MSKRYIYQCAAKGCTAVYDSPGKALLHEDAYGSLHTFKIVVAA